MDYRFVTVTWGDQFTDLLLDVMLPNQLTPGNLGYFRGHPGCVYRIFTREADAARIAKSPVYAKLLSVMPAELVVVPDLGAESGHHAAYDDMSRCHRLAIAEAEAADAAMIFLPGDAIWSEGSFRRLSELCESGYRAVLIAGIRLVRETYVDAFLDRFFDPATLEARAGARDLVAHALNHLHPLTNAYRLDSDQFISFPSHLIWPVEDRGFLLKAFHLHPAIVKPQVPGGALSVTIDHDYLKQACPDPTQIYVVEDSDEILQVAVDARDHRSDLLKPNRFNLTRFAEFAKGRTEDFQRKIFVEKAIYVHSDAIGSDWDKVRAQSAGLVERFNFAMSA